MKALKTLLGLGGKVKFPVLGNKVMSFSYQLAAAAFKENKKYRQPLKDVINRNVCV